MKILGHLRAIATSATQDLARSVPGAARGARRHTGRGRRAGRGDTQGGDDTRGGGAGQEAVIPGKFVREQVFAGLIENAGLTIGR